MNTHDIRPQIYQNGCNLIITLSNNGRRIEYTLTQTRTDSSHAINLMHQGFYRRSDAISSIQGYLKRVITHAEEKKLTDASNPLFLSQHIIHMIGYVLLTQDTVDTSEFLETDQYEHQGTHPVWIYCGEFPLKEISKGRRACRKSWRNCGEGFDMLHISISDDKDDPELLLVRENEEAVNTHNLFAFAKDMLSTDWYLEFITDPEELS